MGIHCLRALLVVFISLELRLSVTNNPTGEPTEEPTFQPTSEPTTDPTTATPSATPTYPASAFCGKFTGLTTSQNPVHWYNFTLPSRADLVIDACDSSFDTWLYFRDALTQSVLSDCNDCGSCGVRSYLPVSDVAAGNDYEIGIGGNNAAVGVYNVEVFCNYLTPPPTRYPTTEPTRYPTTEPTIATGPTTSPTSSSPTTPTTQPSPMPSIEPTAPSTSPTSAPTKSPTSAPTFSPTLPTASPTAAPSGSPTLPTTSPTATPSMEPTFMPSYAPTLAIVEGSLRLASGTKYGSDTYEGRVEVLHDGVWGTVCDDGTDASSEGSVICRQLGYETVRRFDYSTRRDASGPIWMDDVQCNGREERLVDCPFNGWELHNCGHREDLWVQCTDFVGEPTSPPTMFTDAPTSQPSAVTTAPTTMAPTSATASPTTMAPTIATASPTLYPTYGIVVGSLRLMGGTRYGAELYEGRVEVYRSTEFGWGSVCDDGVDAATEGNVICRELGYTVVDAFPNPYAILATPFYISNGPIWMDNVACSGTESRFAHCPQNGWGLHNCDHSEDIWIRCSGFVGATTPAPTSPPSSAPTIEPTMPTSTPTFSPTDQTLSPTPATASPTAAPTDPTASPTFSPTGVPTLPTSHPTDAPSFSPTSAPSFSPTLPTTSPTHAPTLPPSAAPTGSPTSDAWYQNILEKSEGFCKTNFGEWVEGLEYSDIPGGVCCQRSSATDCDLTCIQQLCTSGALGPTSYWAGVGTSYICCNAYTPAPTSPTYEPTRAPTHDPTRAPTPEPTVYPDALWSCSFSQLFVTFREEGMDTPHVTPLTDGDCAEIFAAETVLLFGSDAACSWESTDYIVTVTLAASSTVAVGDALIMNSDTFGYYSFGEFINNSPINITHVNTECAGVAPTIDFSMPLQIGICNDLDLDLRNAILSNLGGRSPALIEWEIVLNEGTQTLHFVDIGQVVIPALDMDPGHFAYVTLRISSWYGATSSVSASVYKSNIAIPAIRLFYPSIFDVYTEAVNLESLISFTDSCFNDTSLDPSLFRYSWSVHPSTNTNANTNASMDPLQRRVQSNTAASLSLSAARDLQAGAQYAFTLHIDCSTDDNIYECEADSNAAVISYQYSPIRCQISGGNKDISIPAESVQELSFTLIGDEWTFNPEGKALSYVWSCVESVYGYTADCSHLIESASEATTQVSFAEETFWFDNSTRSYVYQFSLAVTDELLSPLRPQCTHSVEYTVDVFDTFYLVDVSATTTEITTADRLRLVVSVTPLSEDGDADTGNGNGNGNTQTAPSSLWYEWSTRNDKLSVDELRALRLNRENEANLVLSGSGLLAGTSYEFIINIFNKNDRERQTSLGRASMSIYVRVAPIVYSDVTDCRATFASLLDALFATRTLYISADGGIAPLTYEFGATNMFDGSGSSNVYRFHSDALYQPLLTDAVLPIGCNYSLMNSVTDFGGSTASQSPECCVEIVNPSSCGFSYSTDIVSAYFDDDVLLSNAAKYRYIFQTSFNLLHYLHAAGDDCNANHVNESMQVLSDYFSSDSMDLCTSNHYFYVVQIAQSLAVWLTLNESLNECAHFDAVHDLIQQVLDPCNFIRQQVHDINALDTSSQSVIADQVIVLYEGVEISHNLSALLTDINHLFLTYDLIDAYVDYLSAGPLGDCASTSNRSASIEGTVLFLEKVLFISGLSSISAAIPSESIHVKVDNLEMISIRDDDLSSWNLTVNGVDVQLEIGSQATENDDDDDGSESISTVKDVVLSSITRKETSNTAYAASVANECLENSDGTLSATALSVTIVNNSQNESVYITMVFDYDPSLAQAGDDNAVCVWWNERTAQWDSEGCAATINLEDEKIICRCEHLTTFATISRLKTKEECLAQVFLHWDIVMPAFASVFGLIAVWILGNLFRLKHQGIPVSVSLKNRGVQILTATAVLAVAFVLQCILLYLYSVYPDNDILTVLSIVFLLLPLILYYGIFSLVVGAWINVVHAMKASHAVHKFKMSLRYCTIIVSVIYCTIIVLLIAFDNDDSLRFIIKTGEIVWIVIMTLSIALFTCYGARVVRTIRTVNMMTDGDRGARTSSALRRITIAVFGLNIFFVIQCAETIFSTFYTQQNDTRSFRLYWRIVDLLIQSVCLIVICVLYSSAFRAVAHDSKNGSYLKKKKTNTAVMISSESRQNSSKRSVPPTNELQMTQSASHEETAEASPPGARPQQISGPWGRRRYLQTVKYWNKWSRSGRSSFVKENTGMSNSATTALSFVEARAVFKGADSSEPAQDADDQNQEDASGANGIQEEKEDSVPL